jgi:transcriptional regulator, XRE family
MASLCEEKGITGYRMCKDLSIQPSIVTDLKMGRRSGLKAETANKIAEYFGVTVGYLLGETDVKEKTPAEADVTFDDFTYALHGETKELTEENKQKLLEMARFFKMQQDKEKK